MVQDDESLPPAVAVAASRRWWLIGGGALAVAAVLIVATGLPFDRARRRPFQDRPRRDRRGRTASLPAARRPDRRRPHRRNQPGDPPDRPQYRHILPTDSPQAIHQITWPRRPLTPGQFWADSTFNSCNQFGEQVDEDEYEMAEENTIMFAGFEIDYEVEGDAIIFSLTVPSYTSNGCRQRTAHADNVFYPGVAWERMT